MIRATLVGYPLICLTNADDLQWLEKYLAVNGRVVQVFSSLRSG
jgi:hypothetical protein